MGRKVNLIGLPTPTFKKHTQKGLEQNIGEGIAGGKGVYQETLVAVTWVAGPWDRRAFCTMGRSKQFGVPGLCVCERMTTE